MVRKPNKNIFCKLQNKGIFWKEQVLTIFFVTQFKNSGSVSGDSQPNFMIIRETFMEESSRFDWTRTEYKF